MEGGGGSSGGARSTLPPPSSALIKNAYTTQVRSHNSSLAAQRPVVQWLQTSKLHWVLASIYLNYDVSEESLCLGQGSSKRPHSQITYGSSNTNPRGDLVRRRQGPRLVYLRKRQSPRDDYQVMEDERMMILATSSELLIQKHGVNIPWSSAISLLTGSNFAHNLIYFF